MGLRANASHYLSRAEAHQRVLLHFVDAALFRELRGSGVVPHDKEILSLLVLFERSWLGLLGDHSMLNSGLFLIKVREIDFIFQFLFDIS